MARTNKQRVEQSVAYIKANVSPDLSNKFSSVDKEKVGAIISLKGKGYSTVGWDEQHKAVRALLMCQNQFLGAYAFPDLAKTFFKSKSKTQVNAYIKAHTKLNTTAEILAQKAESYVLNQNSLSYHDRSRADNHISGSAIVCYTGVMLWLFQAGFLTVKGYLNNQPNAYNANQMLGEGKEWDIDNLENIPRGHIWNFQGIEKNVCHWGISLGKGMAAATNNEVGEIGAMVKFLPGGGKQYGKFNLRSQYEVLKLKYGTAQRLTGIKTETEIVKVQTRCFVIDPTMIRFNDNV